MIAVAAPRAVVAATVCVKEDLILVVVVTGEVGVGVVLSIRRVPIWLL